MALFQKMLINNELVQNRNLIGGLMSPPYGLSRFQRDKLKFTKQVTIRAVP